MDVVNVIYMLDPVLVIQNPESQVVPVHRVAKSNDGPAINRHMMLRQYKKSWLLHFLNIKITSKYQ